MRLCCLNLPSPSCRYLDQAQLSKADQLSFIPPGASEVQPRTALSPSRSPTGPVSPAWRAEAVASIQAQVRSLPAPTAPFSWEPDHKNRESLVFRKSQAPERGGLSFLRSLLILPSIHHSCICLSTTFHWALGEARWNTAPTLKKIQVCCRKPSIILGSD